MRDEHRIDGLEELPDPRRTDHADLELPDPRRTDHADLPGEALTPLRRQYLRIKQRHPNLLVLFQIGDFYEAFDDDAHTLARALGVALTRKHFGKNDVHPLAGVPIRALETHLAKLIRQGYKVALCDQVTLPGKGLVEREVTRIITPGTVVEPGLLEGRADNYLAAWIPGEDRAGLAYADVSTGEFRVAELSPAEAVAELERLAPAELLVPGGLEPPSVEVRSVTRLAEAPPGLEAARQVLLELFGVVSLEAFGCEALPAAVRAAAALVVHLRDSQPDALANLTGLQTFSVQAVMQLDLQTLRNLEIFQGWDLGGASAAGSLVATLDVSATAMGGRLLRRWLRHPLLDLGALQARQGAVAWFYAREPVRAKVRATLTECLDLERLLGRVRRRLATPVEVGALARSLEAAGRARDLLEPHQAPAAFLEPLVRCDDLVGLVARALADRLPADLEHGGVIRPGFSRELDELRDILSGGRRFLVELETRERARTGIRSLKVGYNKVFGYYIEVTRPNVRLVPPDYIRKQTLTNAERFFTLELKEHEALIANARERIAELEATLFRQLCEEVGRHYERVRRVAQGVAQIDVYAALAEHAARHRYVRPVLEDGDEIEIRGGRHPMVECAPHGQDFVPNDTRLSGRDCQIMLLTAPNMAGKSIYLRQVALICLLAQIGSFVPAESARIGLVDRVFTRIGLHEYALRGQSSFMLEMIETAHILHHASPRSLVVLDEIGRGTSTADGLAIARAVVEYLHNSPRARARALFATHYHELTGLADTLPRVRNFHLAVAERDGGVEYLHRVAPGRAEKSFGLYVAQRAGLPRPVVHRAKALLMEYGEGLEVRADGGPRVRPVPYPVLPEGFGAGRVRDSGGTRTGDEAAVAALLDTLAGIDIDELTPIEALTRLYELQQRVRQLKRPLP